MIKVMVLQRAIIYHEARDWICLQGQTTLTYQTLLAHCKQLEAGCEQFQQAQDRAHLTTVTAASSSHSSLHANTQSTTTCQPCSRCSYSHPHGTCPAFNHECYNCHTTGHFTTLCRRPHTSRHPADTPTRGGTTEANHAGPGVTDIQAGHSAQEGSHAKSIPDTPEETSAPVVTHLRTSP